MEHMNLKHARWVISRPSTTDDPHFLTGYVVPDIDHPKRLPKVNMSPSQINAEGFETFADADAVIDRIRRAYAPYWDRVKPERRRHPGPAFRFEATLVPNDEMYTPDEIIKVLTKDMTRKSKADIKLHSPATTPDRPFCVVSAASMQGPASGDAYRIVVIMFTDGAGATPKTLSGSKGFEPYDVLHSPISTVSRRPNGVSAFEHALSGMRRRCDTLNFIHEQRQRPGGPDPEAVRDHVNGQIDKHLIGKLIELVGGRQEYIRRCGHVLDTLGDKAFTEVFWGHGNASEFWLVMPQSLVKVDADVPRRVQDAAVWLTSRRMDGDAPETIEINE